MAVALSEPADARWEAHQLRASLFLPSIVEATAEMWTAMMGEPPETEQRRPRELVTRFTGKMGSATAVLASGPLRIDVILQPSRPAQGALPTIVAGDANQLNEQLAERVPALINCLPKLTRVAFAGTVLRQVSAPEESLKLLKSMLKSVTIDEHMRDVMFRVNRPVKMRSGLEINRLTTWSSVSVKIAAVVGPDSPDATLAQDHYLQFEFDNNTAPEPPVSLEPKDATEAFLSCLGLATENMAKGEVVSK